MRIFRALALAGVLALAGSACADLEVTNLNDPDRSRAISTPEDVQNLIAGSFAAFWQTSHHSYPSCAYVVGADDHSSSWGNWGMRNFSWEPRIAYDNDPSYSYNNVTESPWAFSYRSLAAVRDGLTAIQEDGVTIMDGDEDVTSRAVAWGYLVQALSLGNIALNFDQGFIVLEDTDLSALGDPVPYTDIWAAAELKFDAARQAASGQSWVIPADWVGRNGDWTTSYFVEFANAYEARMRVALARGPGDTVPWSTLLPIFQAGLSRDWAVIDNDSDHFWQRLKWHCSSNTIGGASWGLWDVRSIGRADASGAFANYLATDITTRNGTFYIDTDDERISSNAGQDDGLYTWVNGTGGRLRPDRGLYHFGYYHDVRYEPFRSSEDYYMIDLGADELALLEAEALMNLSREAEAMVIINDFRARGNLPEFTDANGVAPGGSRCVPKPDGVNCGDLMEALKYEKHIEARSNWYIMTYSDDRRWGDLVEDTPVHLPIPGKELLLLLRDIYTFGGPDDGTAAPNLLNDFSPEALAMKVKALERTDLLLTEDRNVTVKH